VELHCFWNEGKQQMITDFGAWAIITRSPLQCTARFPGGFAYIEQLGPDATARYGAKVTFAATGKCLFVKPDADLNLVLSAVTGVLAPTLRWGFFQDAD
jgi:hypothetical protein